MGTGIAAVPESNQEDKAIELSQRVEELYIGLGDLGIMPVLGAHLRIGELLIDVGILNQEQITDAVNIAQKRGLPVGRALVMSGLLSEPMLQAALQVQSLFRDGLITREEGVNALQISSLLGVTLEEALDRLRWVQDKKVATQ